MMRLTLGIRTLVVPDNWIFQQHEHRGTEIVGVLDGVVTLCSGGEEWLVGTSEVVVIPPYMPHSWYSQPGAKLAIAHILHMNRDMLDRLLPRKHPRLLQLSPLQFAEYQQLFVRVEAIEKQVDAQYSPLLHAYLEVFLLTLLEGHQDQDTIRILLQEVIAYMRAHLSDTVSVTQLAQSFLMSEVTLRRRFLQVFGVSPKQYLLDLRLSEARHLLLASELSVQEIAHKVGFYDIAHFSSTFRRRFGISPTAWRKSEQL